MIQLITDYPLALESPDYHYLAGTKSDNTTNSIFNTRLYELYPDTKLNVLDIGCSGGGFVNECINDGHFAIGLEGSDYSKNIGRACWPLIPNNLFTCDVAKTFSLVNDQNELVKFDIITLWDVFEHFKRTELNVVFENIRKHLKDNGRLIVSVALIVDIYNPVHQTVESRKWWLEQFRENGFEPDFDQNNHFKNQFLRNPRNNPKYEDGFLVGDDIFCSSFKKIV